MHLWMAMYIIDSTQAHAWFSMLLYGLYASCDRTTIFRGRFNNIQNLLFTMNVLIGSPLDQHFWISFKMIGVRRGKKWNKIYFDRQLYLFLVCLHRQHEMKII